VRPGEEISPSRLRSPDDPEATYRQKAGKAYEGYAGNLTETCHRGNPFQLVLKAQTAPNLTQDTDFLLQALPNLVARTRFTQLYNDAGYCSPSVDEALRKEKIIQIPSDLRGQAPNPERTSLTDLQAQFDEQGLLTQLTCPHGHTFPVKPGKKEGRFLTQVKADPCPECDFTRLALNFSQVELDRALRRQRSRAYRQAGHNLRAAVEATVGALKRPFNNDQLPVRGLFRMSVMMIGSAAMVNIRRIQRHLVEKRKKEQAEADKSDLNAATLSFLSLLRPTFRRQFRFTWLLSSALAFDF
jgi:ssDNA-binding Zn-finger/Zn-ribbon topoisomerase 1